MTEKNIHMHFTKVALSSLRAKMNIMANNLGENAMVFFSICLKDVVLEKKKYCSKIEKHVKFNSLKLFFHSKDCFQVFTHF